MGENATPLEEARVAALSVALFIPIRKHLTQPPPSREKVLEALNALAVVAATVMIGTGPDKDSVEFFMQAVSQNMTEPEEPHHG